MEYLYLLPIVFMIHEFEEIIMLPTWLDKNKAMLYMRFPFMKDKGLSLKPWGIALKFLFLHHENILFPND